MSDILSRCREKYPAQTRALINASSNGMLAHAYMLYADTVQAREEFSALIGQVGACPNLSADASPCGKCNVCRQIGNGSYAELFRLMPVSKSRSILIGDDDEDPDTLRWFQAQFYLSNVSPGVRKVGIISDAECMNAQAQNAFLKTLEEPPGKSIFVLSTSSPFSLLPTIRSRCHMISILSNCYEYDFKMKNEVLQALMRLQACKKPDITICEDSASVIIEASRQLKSEAEENVLPAWQSRLDRAADSDQTPASVRKRITAAYEAAVAAEYLRLRCYFLSLIHSWFGQAFQLSRGVPMESLSNPDFYLHLDMVHCVPDESSAARALAKAEKLLQNLDWNVSEELAFREFCFSMLFG